MVMQWVGHRPGEADEPASVFVAEVSQKGVPDNEEGRGVRYRIEVVARLAPAPLRRGLIGSPIRHPVSLKKSMACSNV